MSRKIIMAGNWKMNLDPEEGKQLINDLKEAAAKSDKEVIVCVPFIDLNMAIDVAKDSKIHVGAQNMHFEDEGAFTGEVSGKMLEKIGTEYVIIGHSERRQYFAETDETVNLKIKAALKYNLKPIVCVGETEEQFDRGETKTIITNQVEKALSGLTKEEMKSIIIAYEPIWAIGTGKTATPEIADNCLFEIREKIKELYDEEISDSISILYGGSVKPANIKELLEKENIDGALVGGASLKADQFIALIDA